MLIKINSIQAYEVIDDKKIYAERMFFYTKCHGIDKKKLCKILENLYFLSRLHGAIPIELNYFMPLEGAMAKCLTKKVYNKLLKFKDYQAIIDDQIERSGKDGFNVYFIDRLPWKIKSYKRKIILKDYNKKVRGDNKLYFYRRLSVYLEGGKE